MPRTKRLSLRKGATPDKDPEERYDPPASSAGPSRRKAPSKKAASRRSPRDDSDSETESFLLAMRKKDKETSSKKQAAEPKSEIDDSNEETSQEETESDEEMEEAGEPIVDIMQIRSDNYALLRHVNQYEKPNSSTDARFHTRFQQEVFAQLYGRHRQFADHKYVDWAHLNSLDKYDGAYMLFQAVGLHDPVALKCDYNEENIRQFYATELLQLLLCERRSRERAGKHLARRRKHSEIESSKINKKYGTIIVPVCMVI